MGKLYFVCGIPGSGKSSWAEANKEKLDFVIHSSDAIREELGDINDQSKNELVFTTLHKRIKKDLLAGRNVCYDATNLKRKNRLHFMQYIKDVPCEKICVLFATPINICRFNNTKRERKVPDEVINRMLKNFECPCKQEGFDDIQIVWWNWKADMRFHFINDLEKWKHISHDNPHHSLSIGDHMYKAWQSMCNNTDDFLLQIATYMHDCGKPYVKDFLDSNGDTCETAHFYQHHCFGSYMSLFYLKDMFEDPLFNLTNEEILYVSLLIELHMNPFLKWNKSSKSLEKDKNLFGEKIINDVLKIHKCDLFAH